MLCNAINKENARNGSTRLSELRAINMITKTWEEMTPEEKKIQLFIKQKNTLDSFLARNAISQAQYDKSLGDLTDKMGMSKVLEELSQAKEY